jgi:beta-glucosidase
MRFFRTFATALSILAASTLPATAQAPATPPASLGQKPFLWGVTISGYQNDGGTPQTDWYHMEKSGRVPDAAGKSADFRGHMDEDLDRAQSLGINAFRTSFEWSRLEPEEGKFDPAEVAHMHRLLKGLRDRGMAPVMSLHHFAMPAWTMVEHGDGVGWESQKTVEAYLRYVEFVVKEFGSEVDYYITFNEPSSFLLGGYGGGMMPPHRVGPFSLYNAYQNVIEAHNGAYELVHAHDPNGMVSISEYNGVLPLGADLTYHPGRFMGLMMGKRFGWDGRQRVTHLDYVALHYYGTNRAFTDFPTKPYLWEGNPAHFATTLREYYEAFHLPILIAENGMASKNGEPRPDGWTREAFMVAHVNEVQKARAAGIPVIGYMHWTLTDNYEWGTFDPRFGLWSVDVRSGDLTRRETPAAGVYREIIRDNGVTPELAKRFPPPGAGEPPAVRTGKR